MKLVLEKFKDLAEKHGLLKHQIEIICNPISTDRAIGTPERKDFPLLKGRERLMEAEFAGSYGQAYTDEFGDFHGTIEDVLSLSLDNNYERAIFISSINAVMKHLNLIKGTRHCRNEGPKKCSERLLKNFDICFKDLKIALIGFQPAMAEKLSSGHFSFRIADLDPDNIGKIKFGTEIMDGEKDIKKIIDWCDVPLVTGTTAVNGKMNEILDICGEKPFIFYGVTIAGIASLMGLTRFCPESF